MPNMIAFQVSKHDLDPLIHQYPDLWVIEGKDLRLNFWEVEEWDTFTNKLNNVYHIFAHICWLLLHSHITGKIAAKRCYEIYEKTGIPPNFKDIKKQIPNAIKQMEVGGWKSKDSEAHIYYILETFIETARILNCRHGMTIKDFWSKKNIILNLMDFASPVITTAIIVIVLKELQRYFETIGNPEGKLRTLVIVDECRRVFRNKESYGDVDHDPNEPMIDWVTTRRSSGIGLLVATQEITSIPGWLFDNSSIVIGHPILGKSRSVLAQNMMLSEEQEKYFSRMDTHGHAIIQDSRFPDLYEAKFPYYKVKTPNNPDIKELP